jgi:hypothetical protein
MIRPNQSPQPIEPGHRNQPRRKLTRIAGVLAAAVVISWGGPAANAFWQTLGSNAGAARADAIPAVAAPSAVVSGGAASISWKQGTTAEGRPVGGYTVARYSSASGGIKVSGTGGCAGIITVLTCSETSLPAGTWYYTVTPVLGAWAGIESARSVGVTAADTTPPAAPTITAPAVINITNSTSVPLSGTAEPGSAVTTTVKDAGAAHTLAQTVTANSSGQWTAPNFNLSTFADGTITYSSTAKDAAGNVSSAGTATSAKDATPPAVTSLTLINGGTNNTIDPGDQVVVKFSEAMNPSTICGNWSATGGSQVVSGSEQVVVNVSTDDVLTVTSTGCGVTRIGSVTLDGNYAGNTALSFHGTGANGSRVSSLAWNAGTLELTITLGSLAGTPLSVNQPGNHRYTPDLGLTDGAGNALAATQFTAAKSKF